MSRSAPRIATLAWMTWWTNPDVTTQSWPGYWIYGYMMRIWWRRCGRDEPDGSMENETVKTWSSEAGEYRCEHHLGHSQLNLSHVVAYLTILAFFMDQIVEQSCGKRQRVHEHQPIKRELLEEMRHIFKEYFIGSWVTFQLLLFDECKHIHGESILVNPP